MAGPVSERVVIDLTADEAEAHMQINKASPQAEIISDEDEIEELFRQEIAEQYFNDNQGHRDPSPAPKIDDIQPFVPVINHAQHRRPVHARTPASPNLYDSESFDDDNSIDAEYWDMEDFGPPVLVDEPQNYFAPRVMPQNFIRPDQIRQPTPPVQNYAPRENIPPQDIAVIVFDTLDDCLANVAAVFPGICLDYVHELYQETSKSSERLIDHILEKGTYPKAKDTINQMKRKREGDNSEDLARKYKSTDRVVIDDGNGVKSFIKSVLMTEFPLVPADYIAARLSDNGFRLLPTYEELSQEMMKTNSRDRPFRALKHPRKNGVIDPRRIDDEIIKYESTLKSSLKADILKEMKFAMLYQAQIHAKQKEKIAAELEEQLNYERAETSGEMVECGCCFGDCPLNRAVRCNGELMHWFCRECVRRYAEGEIGQSKYELTCMSMDQCTAGFSLQQRALFLDENNQKALERLEQEASLRLAGIEGLEKCPFCDFAAVVPPIEIDREFRCAAPDCEKVSCRQCKLESHIPKTCKENQKEVGFSARRLVEEAMSQAMIRKCNKCSTPFVKEEGCNKMTCTRAGCRNIQCYVCSKSCDYGHFDDKARGGKLGNCPLFESVEERHNGEVSKAEKEALANVLAENPDLTEEDLTIEVSERVRRDEEQRKARASYAVALQQGARPVPNVAQGAIGGIAQQIIPQPVMVGPQDLGPIVGGNQQRAVDIFANGQQEIDLAVRQGQPLDDHRARFFAQLPAHILPAGDEIRLPHELMALMQAQANRAGMAREAAQQRDLNQQQAMNALRSRNLGRGAGNARVPELVGNAVTLEDRVRDLALKVRVEKERLFTRAAADAERGTPAIAANDRPGIEIPSANQDAAVQHRRAEKRSAKAGKAREIMDGLQQRQEAMMARRRIPSAAGLGEISGSPPAAAALQNVLGNPIPSRPANIANFEPHGARVEQIPTRGRELLDRLEVLRGRLEEGRRVRNYHARLAGHGQIPPSPPPASRRRFFANFPSPPPNSPPFGIRDPSWEREQRGSNVRNERVRGEVSQAALDVDRRVQQSMLNGPIPRVFPGNVPSVSPALSVADPPTASNERKVAEEANGRDEMNFGMDYQEAKLFLGPDST